MKTFIGCLVILVILQSVFTKQAEQKTKVKEENETFKTNYDEVTVNIDQAPPVCKMVFAKTKKIFKSICMEKYYKCMKDELVTNSFKAQLSTIKEVYTCQLKSCKNDKDCEDFTCANGVCQVDDAIVEIQKGCTLKTEFNNNTLTMRKCPESYECHDNKDKRVAYKGQNFYVNYCTKKVIKDVPNNDIFNDDNEDIKETGERKQDEAF